MRTLANVLPDERLINENFRFIKRFLRFTVEKWMGFWLIWEFPLINLMLQKEVFYSI
jgi:hypothetical protein